MSDPACNTDAAGDSLENKPDDVCQAYADNASDRACTVPIKPGSAHASAAYRSGCEDEWADRMRSRYGGEW
jgi:hypothetical protein